MSSTPPPNVPSTQASPVSNTNSVYITIAIDNVPIESELMYSLYVKIGEKHILLRSQGETLSPDRAQQLRTKKVESLYVSRADWKAFIRSLELGLASIGVQENSAEYALGVRNLIDVYWRDVQESQSVDHGVFTRLKELTAKVPAVLQKNVGLVQSLVKRYEDPGLYFSNHSVNIIVYSVTIGLRLGLGLSDLQDLALAACLANLGNIRIPHLILNKPGRLTPDEWKIVQNHPRLGSDIMKSLLVPPKVVQAALHHHERLDGAGYPDKLAGQDIPQHSRIISIAEVFNAMTSSRPWGKPYEGAKAMEMMQQMVGKFDPAILKMI